MSAATQHAFLFRLLYDEPLRARFFADRAGVAEQEGLTPSEQAAFSTLDRTGLELDALMRRDVLMRTLCRPYPLTAAAMGSLPEGAQRLSTYLSSATAASDASARTHGFGEHLAQVLSAGTTMPPEWDEFVRSLLGFEQGLVREAAALRRSVEQGHLPPAVVKGQSSHCLARPEYFTAAELSVPTALVKGALSQVGPDDCWQQITSGSLSAQRLLSVARAEPMPVTLVARAIVSPRTPPAPGVGGTPLVVVVVHPTAELNGRYADALYRLDGKTPLSAFAQDEQSIFTRLAQAGILEAR